MTPRGTDSRVQLETRVTSSAFVARSLARSGLALPPAAAEVVSAHQSPPSRSLPFQDICEDISDHVEQIHALLETEFSLKLLSYSVNIIVDIRLVSVQHYKV